MRFLQVILSKKNHYAPLPPPRGKVGRYGAVTLVIGILYCEFVKKLRPVRGVAEKTGANGG